MMVRLLLAILLFLPFRAHAQQVPTVTLVPDRATVAIPPATGGANGLLHVTVSGIDPAAVILRAMALTLGDAYAFVRFPDSQSDVVSLKALQCQQDRECVVRYEVYGAWSTGAYQGSIDAYSPQGKIGATPVAAIRPTAPFKPIVISEAMHDGRLVFDATTEPSFLFSVQNPAGSPPHHIMLAGGPDDPACKALISFAPADLHLEPGASQTVIATVAPCLAPGANRFATLKLSNADQPGVWTETVVALSRHQPATRRQLSLLVFVLIGSGVSVLLNNIFPVNRIKSGFWNDLRRADELLRDCANASPALLDGLSSESKRLRLSLRSIHWYDANKLTATQEAQQAIAKLLTAARVAQQVSLMRSKIDGAIVSISLNADLSKRLREAEEALLANDNVAANDRVAEAQAKLTGALADVQQNTLREALTIGLPKLLTERWTRRSTAVSVKAEAAKEEADRQTAAGGAEPAEAPPKPEQWPQRNPRIKAIIAQFPYDNPDLQKLSAREILDIERDFYVADIWTEYVEDRLELLESPALRSRLPAFQNLANALLNCLLHNPKSDHVQVLLDLLRCDVTPDDVAAALAHGNASIECDPRPRYLEMINIGFRFTDPLLNDVPAARRLLEYSWQIDDGTAQPPNVERFRHYFRSTGWRWRWPWQPPASEIVRRITLDVRVLFTASAVLSLPSREVRPRSGGSSWWKFEPMELTSFIVVTAIAVVTAFGAHYAQSLPDVVTWSDWLSSFMLGFGLDQLRATVTPPTANTAPPTVAAGTVPAQPLASH